MSQKPSILLSVCTKTTIALVLSSVSYLAQGSEETPSSTNIVQSPTEVGSVKKKLSDLPNDLLGNILSFLDGQGVRATTCNRGFSFFSEKKYGRMVAKNNATAIARRLDELLGEIAVIPSGILPSQVAVSSFQVTSHPVTRELWMEIMKTAPQTVLARNGASERQESLEKWGLCPSCPATEIIYENADLTPGEGQIFIKKLNERLKIFGYFLRVPSNSELHYMIRGDREGTNRDPYSYGVTPANIKEYITCDLAPPSLRVSTATLQPVGKKQKNAFGIELGNVRTLSSTLVNPDDPASGRIERGVAFYEPERLAKSARQSLMEPGTADRASSFFLVKDAINQPVTTSLDSRTDSVVE